MAYHQFLLVITQKVFKYEGGLSKRFVWVNFSTQCVQLSVFFFFFLGGGVREFIFDINFMIQPCYD